MAEVPYRYIKDGGRREERRAQLREYDGIGDIDGEEREVKYDLLRRNHEEVLAAFNRQSAILQRHEAILQAILQGLHAAGVAVDLP